MSKNQAAAALARLGRGVPKTLTDEQRQAKATLLAKARAKRWPKKTQPK